MAVQSQVLIIDDHPMFRDGVELACASLERRPVDIRKASSLSEGLGLVVDVPFDLVLLDLNLPDARGLEGLARFRESAPDTHVSVISATDTTDAMSKAHALGAVGYIPKSIGLDALAVREDLLLPLRQGGIPRTA